MRKREVENFPTDFRREKVSIPSAFEVICTRKVFFALRVRALPLTTSYLESLRVGATLIIHLQF